MATRLTSKTVAHSARSKIPVRSGWILFDRAKSQASLGNIQAAIRDYEEGSGP